MRLLYLSVLLVSVHAFCDFTALNMGCDHTPPLGFVDLNVMNDTQGVYESVLALSIPINKSGILIMDVPRLLADNTTLAGSTITTHNNSLHLSSPSLITLETLDKQGVMFEGRIRLWLTGMEVDDNSKPICLMMNDTLLGCIGSTSHWDSDVLFYWKFIALSLSAFIFALFLGIVIGACAYRSRLKRVATDPDLAHINLDSDDDDDQRL